MQKCPYCKSASTVKRGFRYNMKGKTPVRLCTKCKRIFTPDKFARMRYPEKTILRAVHKYKKAKSSAKVQRMLSSSGIKVSRWTIIKWSRKYR